MLIILKIQKLSDLILEISEIKDLKRIRYTTSHPKILLRI